MTTIQIKPTHLIDECREALQGLRRALIELYGAVGADPSAPQEVSRRYGLNRNLTWKLSRIINAAEPFDTLNHLPGNQGMELAVVAFEKAGAPKDYSQPVRAALARLQDVTATHAGNREHLELTLESMGVFQRDTTAESGREFAFRGNSMTWGVQARTRWSATFFGPGASGDLVDMVTVAGLVEFRRLRPDVRWRLQRTRMYDDKGGTLRQASQNEDFEPKSPGEVPEQIREFCSPDTPTLVVVDTADGREVFLPEGPVGNRGAFDIFTGGIQRGLPRYRTETEKEVSRGTSITLPVENVVVDIIVHRDLVLPSSPNILLQGFPHGLIGDPRSRSTAVTLPNADRFVELAGSPPAVSTPAVPRITRMVERVFARMDWNPADFRGVRLHMQYPPMSSVLLTYWPLPDRETPSAR